MPVRVFYKLQKSQRKTMNAKAELSLGAKVSKKCLELEQWNHSLRKRKVGECWGCLRQVEYLQSSQDQAKLSSSRKAVAPKYGRAFVQLSHGYVSNLSILNRSAGVRTQNRPFWLFNYRTAVLLLALMRVMWISFIIQLIIQTWKRKYSYKRWK